MTSATSPSQRERQLKVGPQANGQVCHALYMRRQTLDSRRGLHVRRPPSSEGRGGELPSVPSHASNNLTTSPHALMCCPLVCQVYVCCLDSTEAGKGWEKMKPTLEGRSVRRRRPRLREGQTRSAEGSRTTKRRAEASGMGFSREVNREVGPNRRVDYCGSTPSGRWESYPRFVGSEMGGVGYLQEMSPKRCRWEKQRRKASHEGRSDMSQRGECREHRTPSTPVFVCALFGPCSYPDVSNATLLVRDRVCFRAGSLASRRASPSTRWWRRHTCGTRLMPGSCSGPKLMPQDTGVCLIELAESMGAILDARYEALVRIYNPQPTFVTL